MTRLFKSLAVAALLAALAIGPALAQQATAIQQSASRLDAGGAFVFAPAPSINQTQASGTITIPANAGLCAYVDSLLIGLGVNATSVTAVQTYTTTNLGGLAYSFFPVVVATSPSQPIYSQQMVGATPIKAAACGVATVITPPAQNANIAFPVMAYGHFAP